MIKRVISIAMIFVMLVTISPAVAADDASVQPTVGEILSEYHQKAFEAAHNEDTDAVTTYSRRSGSSTTLEQETVDTLTAAGYEAYNITADNYDALETQLQTDFESMGLDPEGSYIVVVGGGEPDANHSVGTYAYGDNLVTPTPDPGGSSGDTSYTYNGTTYIIRYLTVTGSSQSGLIRSSTYDLSQDLLDERWSEVLEFTLTYICDKALANVPVASIASLAVDLQTSSHYTALENSTLTIHSQSIWTLKYLQVWDSGDDSWKSSFCTSYVESKSRCVGYLYDETTNSSVWCNGVESYSKTYSPFFNSTNEAKEYACQMFLRSDCYYDRTGDVDFYLKDESGIVDFTGNGDPLFSHYDWGI